MHEVEKSTKLYKEVTYNISLISAILSIYITSQFMKKTIYNT